MKPLRQFLCQDLEQVKTSKKVYDKAHSEAQQVIDKFGQVREEGGGKVRGRRASCLCRRRRRREGKRGTGGGKRLARKGGVAVGGKGAGIGGKGG